MTVTCMDTDLKFGAATRSLFFASAKKLYSPIRFFVRHISVLHTA